MELSWRRQNGHWKSEYSIIVTLAFLAPRMWSFFSSTGLTGALGWVGALGSVGCDGMFGWFAASAAEPKLFPLNNIPTTSESPIIETEATPTKSPKKNMAF